jgi:chromosome partitioning protein
VSLSSALAQLGANVLLIDLDQQGSATRHLGLDPETATPNLFHVFKKQVPAGTAVQEIEERLHIIPGTSLLAAIEEALEEGDETMLKELVSGVKHHYDYVVLDSPPGKAMLSFNALSAADEVIIPLPAERPALDGVQDLMRFITEVVWDKYNPALKISGILPTMFKRTTTHSAGVLEKAREIWGDKVFSAVVPETIEFPRAYNQGVSILVSNPEHEGASAYRELARIIHHGAPAQSPPAPPPTAPASSQAIDHNNNQDHEGN